MFVSQIEISLSEAGLIGAVATYAEADASGRVRQLGRRRVQAADIEALMPSVAALTEQAATLVEERNAAVAERDAIAAEKDGIIAVRDGQIAELKAQMAPVDENGFAVLSPVQIRLGLLDAGITADRIDAVIEAIADPADREAARYFWEYSREYHRDHALVRQFAGALGLTSEQVDQMWTAAAKL